MPLPEEKQKHSPASPEYQDRSYWEQVSNDFSGERRYLLWRAHSDQVNTSLLNKLMQGKQYGRILKTDLFDESLTAGLYPCLAGHAAEVHGMDLSESCIREAARRFPEMETHRMDIRRTQFEDGSFDSVVSTSTLDHFEIAEELERALGEIHRILKPGGDLFITMDNLQNPAIWLRNMLPYRWLGRTGLVPYFVGHTVTRNGLHRLLERTGFRTQDSRPVLHCPRVLAVPYSEMVRKRGNSGSQDRLLEKLLAWERLERWPGAWFTAHFVAVHAIRL